MDQDFLPRLKFRHLEQSLPCGQCRQGQGTCRHQVQFFRHDGQFIGRGQGILRITATAGRESDHAHDPVTGRQGGHVGTYSDNLSGDIVTGRPRQRILDLPRRETKPLPGFPVDRIEPGTVHPDEHLIVSGDWHIGRDHLQDVTLTKAIVDHMAHRGFSVLIGSIFHEDLRTTG